MKIFNVITACVLLFLSINSHATVITFDDQVVESKGPVYVVNDVTFFNNGLNSLFVVPQGGGNALAVLDDDAGYLEIFFPTINNFFSLDFGNDMQGNTASGDIALLTLFLNGNMVGQTSVILNRNDLLDQTISLSQYDFNAATFAYTHSNGVPINLTELVDNVAFARGRPTAIPEPAGLALLLAGGLGAALSGLAGARRKQQ